MQRQREEASNKAKDNFTESQNIVIWKGLAKIINFNTELNGP